MKYTPEQQSFIDSDEKRGVVLAGAGSGKTAVIAGKIARHLNEGRSGYDFLAITFSRYAAQQLQQRVNALDDGENYKIDVFTFHALALDVVQKFTAKKWQVVDQTDWEYILDGCGYWPMKFSYREWSKGKISAPTAHRDAKGAFGKLRDGILWLTYDEILLQLLGMPDALAWLRDRYAYLFVDEAQDMTPEQLRLAEAMGIEHTYYIGDVSQSIYEWNGAAPGVFMGLSESRPVFPLTTNFRSPAGVVDRANRLIAGNKMRLDLPSVPVQGGDGVHEWIIEDDPIERVIDVISVRIKDYKPDDIVVLCRTNREIEQVLGQGGALPLSGVATAARLKSAPLLKVFRDILAVRLSGSRQNWLLLERDCGELLVGYPNSKADRYAFMRKVDDIMGKLPDWVLEVVREERFYGCVQKFIRFAEVRHEYDDVLLVKKLTEKFFDSDLSGSGEHGFLGWYSTLSMQDLIELETGVVRVMTVHQAKGLEFPVVIFLLPQFRSSDEESRRVVYVGMTRASLILDIVSGKENKYLIESRQDSD